jgi:lysine 2,3-aminomutase
MAKPSLVTELAITSEEPPPLVTETPEEPPSLTAAEPVLSITGFKRPFSGLIPASNSTREFLHEFYPHVSLSDWSNWKWQLQNSLLNVGDLQRLIRLSPKEEAALNRPDNTCLPVRITPYYMSLIDQFNPLQPVRRAVIPVDNEFIRSIGEEKDPLGEDHQSPVPGIVHRYPDRVLFLTTSFCSTYCRYCTRSRMVGNNRFRVSRLQWEKAIEYIESTKQVRDVLLSGGDPLTLPSADLDYLISRIRAIPHVEIIRIGTKVPVVLPYRITSRLIRILRKHQPLWMSIHFTHPDELTPETSAACGLLADAGVPMGSQTVLLKGINDDAETLKKLFTGLLKIRVRPYYLYQCDPIVGSSHFRTPVGKGLEMIESLRGHTSGYAVPHYVIDAPGGGGKIAILPQHCLGNVGSDLLLSNYEGRLIRYPDNN